jgi:hypothetical protein
LKIKLQFVSAVLSILALAGMGVPAQSQDAHEDLSACPGSAPEPSQSAEWAVAFCNRTGHDLVIEFHDNECPASGWTRRGDVYQRTLKRGESRTLPLCYANEPAGKKPPPGVPTLRIPGGKGVTTTWTVVGDCGDHSKPLNMGAQTFYDRGDFKTGIILLQNPAGASHCASDAATASAAPASAAGSYAAAAGSASPATSPAYAPAAAPGAASAPAYAPAGTPAGATPTPYASAPTTAAPAPYGAAAGSTAATSAVQGQPAVAPHGTLAAPPTAPAAPAVPRTGGEPTLTASVPTSGLIQHSVQVFAKGGAGYRCNMNLLVTFSDGATWNDKTKADITGNDEQVPIATRKYLKTPTDVKITSNKCAPM